MPYPPDCRINRYIMECKCHKMNFYTACILELIDTLWNVNDAVTNANVIIGQGINRYIMECKWKVRRVRQPFLRINRYIMECK